MANDTIRSDQTAKVRSLKGDLVYESAGEKVKELTEAAFANDMETFDTMICSEALNSDVIGASLDNAAISEYMGCGIQFYICIRA